MFTRRVFDNRSTPIIPSNFFSEFLVKEFYCILEILETYFCFHFFSVHRGDNNIDASTNNHGCSLDIYETSGKKKCFKIS